MPVTDDDDYDGPVTMAATQSTTSKAEQRKSNKPIMEKRRRARINHCLNELKTLILNAMKKDPARHSKLEKADILEMTVKHLQNIQRQQLAAAVSTDPSVITRFRNGFDECAAEVSRYIDRLDGVDNSVKQRLSAHLHRCVNSLQQMTPQNSSGAHDDNNNSNQRALLIPSRLPTGELALVLPNYNSFLAAAPSSAFTAIKPQNDNKSRRFQPFQVEIPNSHLTAHISLPEGFERSPAVPSPKPFDLFPPSASEQLQKSQISTMECVERLHSNSSLSEPDTYSRSRMREIENRPENLNRQGTNKASVLPAESTERLLPTQVHQKPNPNFVLNPKSRSSPHKFVRQGELARGRSVMDCSEPPAKTARLTSTSPHEDSRSPVIAAEPAREVSVATVSRPIQQQQEVDTTQRDMWRPW